MTLWNCEKIDIFTPITCFLPLYCWESKFFLFTHSGELKRKNCQKTDYNKLNFHHVSIVGSIDSIQYCRTRRSWDVYHFTSSQLQILTAHFSTIFKSMIWLVMIVGVRVHSLLGLFTFGAIIDCNKLPLCPNYIYNFTLLYLLFYFLLIFILL